MFGRATIRLGIGPHSNSLLNWCTSAFAVSYFNYDFALTSLLDQCDKLVHQDMTDCACSQFTVRVIPWESGNKSAMG